MAVPTTRVDRAAGTKDRVGLMAVALGYNRTRLHYHQRKSDPMRRIGLEQRIGCFFERCHVE